MNKDSNGNNLSVISKLKSEFVLILFAGLVSSIVSISTTFYMNYIKSLNQEKNLSKALYFEILRNNFTMWQIMSNLPEDITLNHQKKIYFCLPYDTSIFKSNSGQFTDLTDELVQSIDEFYGILFHINHICQWVKIDPKNVKKIDNDITNIYFRLIKQGMNVGTEVLLGLEKKLDFPPFFNDVYKDKMNGLREKTFNIHPELKDNLGKPIFIYDEIQNMMILKGIE